MNATQQQTTTKEDARYGVVAELDTGEFQYTRHASHEAADGTFAAISCQPRCLRASLIVIGSGRVLEGYESGIGKFIRGGQPVMFAR